MRKRKINILHLVLSLNIGGLEHIVYNLTSRLDKTRFNVFICCLDEFGNLKDKFKNLNIDPILLKRKERGVDWLLPIKLARIIKQKQINIIHTHNFSPNFYGSIAGQLSLVPKIITTQHNRRFFERLSFKRLLVFRVLYYLNHKIIFVSENAKDLAIKITKIPSKKLMIIHNGIDTNTFQPKPKKKVLLNELGINDEFIIGTVSRLSKEKDISTLLKAFKYILEKEKNIKLLIVGEGPEKAALIKEAFRLNINSHVIFAGYREDIPDLLNIIDIFVITSLTEGISLTLLEAMAAQKPVVATRVGGNTEVIENGHSGILVEPKNVEIIANRLIDLIYDSKKRAYIAFNARRRVLKKFSLEKMVDAYTKLYLSD